DSARDIVGAGRRCRRRGASVSRRGVHDEDPLARMTCLIRTALAAEVSARRPTIKPSSQRIGDQPLARAALVRRSRSAVVTLPSVPVGGALIRQRVTPRNRVPSSVFATATYEPIGLVAISGLSISVSIGEP